MHLQAKSSYPLIPVLFISSDQRAFLEADNDVILISTSILSLSEVLNSLPVHCLQRHTLIADVLSVKEHPRNVLLQVNSDTPVKLSNFYWTSINQVYRLLTQVLPEEMDVLCTHPMFGPESGQNGWKDFAFVYEKVRIRDEATCSSFLRIFESEVIQTVRLFVFFHYQAILSRIDASHHNMYIYYLIRKAKTTEKHFLEKQFMCFFQERKN